MKEPELDVPALERAKDKRVHKTILRMAKTERHCINYNDIRCDICPINAIGCANVIETSKVYADMYGDDKF